MLKLLTVRVICCANIKFFYFSLQQILNHCIDDIENLVLRTKKSAEAWKKLHKKKGKSKRKFSNYLC